MNDRLECEKKVNGAVRRTHLWASSQGLISSLRALSCSRDIVSETWFDRLVWTTGTLGWVCYCEFASAFTISRFSTSYVPNQFYTFEYSHFTLSRIPSDQT